MLFAIHCLSVTNSVIHPPPCTGMVICVGQRWSPSELVPRAAVPAICGQCLWSIDVSGYIGRAIYHRPRILDIDTETSPTR